MMEAVVELCPEKFNIFKISVLPHTIAHKFENVGYYIIQQTVGKTMFQLVFSDTQ